MGSLDNNIKRVDRKLTYSKDYSIFSIFGLLCRIVHAGRADDEQAQAWRCRTLNAMRNGEPLTTFDSSKNP